MHSNCFFVFYSDDWTCEGKSPRDRSLGITSTSRRVVLWHASLKPTDVDDL